MSPRPAQAADLSFRWSAVPGLGHVKKGCKVYDVNARKMLGDANSVGAGGTAGYTARGVGSHDSVFVTLSDCE